MHKTLTVITPASSLDLTVLATAKVHLDVTGTTLDTKIQNWIKQASDAIASECDRVFGKETIKETLYLTGTMDKIVLERTPVASITSVVVDGVTIDAADYTVHKGMGLLSRLSSDVLTCWSGNKIEVTYVGGFELLSELPYDVERACLSLISHYYSAGGRDPLAKRIEIPDVQTVDYWVGSVGQAGQLPPDVVTLIAPYRRWSV